MASIASAGLTVAARAGERLTVGGSIGYEYDDNVTVSEADAQSGVGDSSGVLDLSTSWKLIDAEPQELEVAYGFYQSRYSDVGGFDLRLHLPSIAYTRRVGSLDWGAEYRYAHTSLGDDTFYQSHTVIPSVGRLFGDSIYLMGALEYDHRDFVRDHPVSADTNARDADRPAIRLDGIYLLGDGRGNLRASYRLLRQFARGGEFDYLANEVQLATGLRFQGWRLWKVRSEAAYTRAEVGYEYERRDYDQGRDDRQHNVRASLELPIVYLLRGRFQYERLDSDSNLPAADYVSNVVTFSLAIEF